MAQVQSSIEPLEPMLSELNVACFPEWATPNLVAKAENRYSERLGVAINWVSFNSGVDMMQAMVAGDIDIAYSVGMAPFVSAVNEGAMLQTVAVAAQYSAIPCYARNESGIDATDPASFVGKTVALPFGTMADYSAIRQMESLGLTVEQLNVLNVTSMEASNALLNGAADLACAFGAEATEIVLMAGRQVFSRAEMESRGVIAFDVVAVTDALAASNTSTVKEFLAVTDEYNAAYEGTQLQLELIVNVSQLDQQTALNQLNDLVFQSSATLISNYRNEGGAVVQAFNVAGKIYSSDGSMASDDYSFVINGSLFE